MARLKLAKTVDQGQATLFAQLRELSAVTEANLSSPLKTFEPQALGGNWSITSFRRCAEKRVADLVFCDIEIDLNNSSSSSILYITLPRGTMNASNPIRYPQASTEALKAGIVVVGSHLRMSVLTGSSSTSIRAPQLTFGLYQGENVAVLVDTDFAGSYQNFASGDYRLEIGATYFV